VKTLQQRGLEVAKRRRMDTRYSVIFGSLVAATGILLLLFLIHLLAPPKPLTTIPFGAIFQPQPDQSWMRSI
jgi:hypothetical protein